jgi:dUTP pyrophosphatase
MIEVPVHRAPEVRLPAYKTGQAAGMDLEAHLAEGLHLQPLERCLVPTGLSLALPQGYEGQVRPRSGLAYKKGLTVLNAPGTIDADYRGEVKVLLVNLSNEAVEVAPGERIAQLVIARHETVQWQETDDLAATERGSGGFGSTGTH